MYPNLINLAGRHGSARIAILTILQEELDAVHSVFGPLQNLIGTPYYVAETADVNAKKFEFIVSKAGDRGNTPASQALAEIMENYKPPFLVLVGIAGGFGKRDGLALGDVVIADAVEYCEFKKLQKGKILRRLVPLSHPSAYLRTNFAEPLTIRPSTWTASIKSKRPVEGSPKALVGNIVAGETLMADPGSSLQKQILSHYDKALAVDMESFGVAREIFAHPVTFNYNPQYLIVRGISDLVNPESAEQDNQATREKWKVYAAEAAAAFALNVVRNCIHATRAYFESADVSQSVESATATETQSGGVA